MCSHCITFPLLVSVKDPMVRRPEEDVCHDADDDKQDPGNCGSIAHVIVFKRLVVGVQSDEIGGVIRIPGSIGNNVHLGE